MDEECQCLKCQILRAMDRAFEDHGNSAKVIGEVLSAVDDRLPPGMEVVILEIEEERVYH